MKRTMVEPTREQIATEALENAINNCGFNPKRFAESTTRWHRMHPERIIQTGSLDYQDLWLR